jgi:hypothetical protein
MSVVSRASVQISLLHLGYGRRYIRASLGVHVHFSAHCRLGLGKLYWREGKQNQALEHLMSARTVYPDMG